ncbi:MAG: hydrogenase [Chloroflexota bacterium]|nr:MAG: hydrogenase [Chloroflexota bacterium]
MSQHNGETSRATTLLICRGTSCQSSKSNLLQAALEEEIGQRGLKDRVQVQLTGCHGFCHVGPTVIVEPEGILYTHVKVEDAARIVQEHLIEEQWVDDLLYRDPLTGETIPHQRDITFYSKQQRHVLRNTGRINPERIEDYMAVGGYSALRNALFDGSPEQVLDEIRKAGLRGRGGGGQPTANKWEMAARTAAGQKYVIANGDEGDPGSFMDRTIIEGDPHALLEGMLLAAYAVGASQGYLYLRTEYTLATQRFRVAIAQAREKGILGPNVMGSSFAFDVDIKHGVGAYVGGEETGIIATIEGRRPMPSPKPPYPAESGLWGRPTVINNVETLANVPLIMSRGADWFAGIGTAGSRGTKIFALTGKVVSPGLVEVPLGTTLREIIFGIGGGVPEGRKFKAAQTDGPTGNCIPGSLLDLPTDWETMAEAGVLIGDGAMVVMDDTTCMVDTARFFTAFSQSESCGKCVPCRLGTKRLLDVVDRITSGKAEMSDLDLLVELGETISAGSLCGLGMGAANPVLSTLKHFRDEYVAHVRDKKCEAVVCKGLVKAPCSHTCPAGIDIPRYIRLIAAGRYADAVTVIRERNPLPSVCGRVCFHPCESKCRRGQVDQPLGINYLKRFAAGYDGRWENQPPPLPPTGKKVAVVGSGPAGLAASFFLARLGHAVTIFEALPVAGGVLRVGIPAYRLPEDILEMEIDNIRRLGVDLLLNSPVEKLDTLFEEGYDAVFLGMGSVKGMKLGVEGEDDPAVFDCMSFLRDFRLGLPTQVGQRVVVVGGGNAAIDAARTSLRLGAKEVTIIYRRTAREMPALPAEVQDAVNEGTRVEYLVAPDRIVRDGGTLRVLCHRMELGPMDASGRRGVVAVPGSEFELVADTVIAAIGQATQLPPGMGLKANRNGTVKVDSHTLATERPGVFAGGDAVTGPASVIAAIAAGRRAASSIDRYLGGSGVIDISDSTLDAEPWQDEEDVDRSHRHHPPAIPVEAREGNFMEVELSFDAKVALQEALRCLRCDLED